MLILELAREKVVAKLLASITLLKYLFWYISHTHTLGVFKIDMKAQPPHMNLSSITWISHKIATLWHRPIISL